jgi:hypothetical protein
MELQIACFSNKMVAFTGGLVRLIWSQPATPQDRQRGLLPTALICIFLGGVVVNAGGRDAGQTPRIFRAAAASLLATGSVLFLIGGASLLFQKARRSGPTLTLADSAEAGGESESSLRKEDQQ